MPDNFWAVKSSSTAWPARIEAPLIFIIAGTGAPYSSSINEYLKKLFYQGGFHVVQLSSPTSYDFISAASRFATPGVSQEGRRRHVPGDAGRACPAPAPASQ